MAPARAGKDQVAYQTRIASVPNGLDMVAKVSVMADGRPGYSLTPVFETASRAKSNSALNLPLIPGGRDEGS
jgi:hypothetical protein